MFRVSDDLVPGFWGLGKTKNTFWNFPTFINLKLNCPLEMMKDTVWPFSLIQDQMQFWSLLKYFEKMAKSHSIRPNWLDTRAWRDIKDIFFVGRLLWVNYLRNTYTTLLGPTRLLISEIFLSKPNFHLYKCGKILPTQPY